MTQEEFLDMLADLVTEMEEEAGCVGATAAHIKTILTESIKAEKNKTYIPAMQFGVALELANRAKQEEMQFAELTEALFDPNELEALNSGAGEEE